MNAKYIERIAITKIGESTMSCTLPSLKEMTQAMLDRDTTYDGIFFTCVKTTGIFCRPSCSARKPLLQNVEFKQSVRDCLLGGFRPCLRCKPLTVGANSPAWLDELVALVESAPNEKITDQTLRSRKISPYAARRYFQQRFGLTFQAYHRTRRMGLALRHIQAGSSDLDAAFDNGYDSLSGFREAFQKTFGVTPMNSQDLTCILTKTLDSPVGPLVACATDDGICLLEFADRRALTRQIETLKSRLNGIVVPGTNSMLERLTTELQEYFNHARTTFSVPLIALGTTFQQMVWDQLLKIPISQTRSYDQIAHFIGKPGAQRAVGRANGDNRIAILIPCHRVVRSDGTLSGYGGGVWRKKFLLDLEQSADVDHQGLEHSQSFVAAQSVTVLAQQCHSSASLNNHNAVIPA